MNPLNKMKLFFTLAILAWLPITVCAQGDDINILKKHDTTAFNVAKWTDGVLGKIRVLKKNISAAKTDNEKLNAIFLLCDANESLNNDTLFAYTMQAKKLALKTKNQLAVIRANYFLTVCYANKGDLARVI